MEEHVVKILATEYITHNVKRFVVEKPKGYHFKAGQATDVSINMPEWKNEKRPFSFTSLNSWKNLEFTVKIYRERNGVTNQLEKLHVGDELIIHDAWGAITYKGKGVFIAGGAGITPFIAIIRQLHTDRKLKGNKLIFSNKTSADIILKNELSIMLKNDLYIFLTREHVLGFSDKRIDEEYLQLTIRNFSQYFYVCGPNSFVKYIQNTLLLLGTNSDAVIIENESLVTTHQV